MAPSLVPAVVPVDRLGGHALPRQSQDFATLGLPREDGVRVCDLLHPVVVVVGVGRERTADVLDGHVAEVVVAERRTANATSRRKLDRK